MKLQRSTILFATAFMLIGSSVSFAAVAANGTFTFNSVGGLITYTPPTPASILGATSITIPTPTATSSCGVPASNVCEQVTSIPGTYQLLQNDFAAGGLTPLSIGDDVTFNSYTFDLTFATLPVFHFTTQQGNRFTFTALSGQESTSSTLGSDFVNVGYLGTFSDSGGTYLTSPALLAVTFTQTGGSTGSVGFSGVFATPPPNQTPEPATMALLGSALIGLGVMGRKRLARK